ncbi:succinyldiaminopimelate transaminase [Nocardia donostiensis]|uniref:Succinyldiaminopimelate transaminase n=1 Tax=Nocardia donostiensis TaxID=1538463 RepID=A0A1V2TME3_9NOCA|nr:succinyldiaminopimelate transaminase [Nocardia donostiensis]ONM50658.1 succinyldiaminopimelate transaminase [Nocardia donostiensis]OQS17630.1 succinyldiaminopimelate transaminase [Nocardia donostiensis]
MNIEVSSRRRVSTLLPDFPWDTIADAKAKAAAYPGGLADLSVGTPVDPVDPLIRAALNSVAEVPGYPTTHGTPELRSAAAQALRRRYGVTGVDPAAVLPVIGTKELIAGLPRLLGLDATDLVVIPEVAYPTYEVGALLGGTRIARADGLAQLGPVSPALIFLNSPANPTGKVLGVEHLRKVVSFARERGTIVVADECYLGLTWEGSAPSLLDPRVCDGDHTNLLVVHSLSKTSNLASYRAGFVTGDPELVAELLEVRKHSGMMVPLPIQAAMTAALGDDEHEARQRERYRARRDILRTALTAAGFRIDNSEAGLYLWCTRDEPCRTTLDWLADRGILAAPGDFYGPAGSKHVRIALTATDERVAAAAERLTRRT